MENNELDVTKTNEDIAQNTNEKTSYTKLRNEIQMICENLHSSKTYLDEANDQLRKNYTVDNESADQGKLSQVSNSIDEIIKYLQNNIIPAINSEINGLNESITALEELLGGEVQ